MNNLSTNWPTNGLNHSCWYFVHRYNATNYFRRENIVNRMTKRLFRTSAAVLVATLAFSNFAQDEGSAFCSCSQTTVFDTQLPMSHPVNRCAAQISNRGVSWSSWISGRSNSYSFHFIDLLELLSRHSEAPKDKTTTQSWSSIPQNEVY